MAIDTTTSVDVETLTPFKKFIMTIGNIPTSYLESMSYAELLMWLCNYLQETVIPTVNNNAEAVEELQNLYEELRTYVNDYFDNLDIQDEINNKLDQMASSGVLTQLIGNYCDPLIEQQNALIGNLQQQINSVVTNPPQAVSTIEEMTNTDQIYILTTDGKWYYYDSTNTEWVAGGDYQSTSFNDLIQIKPTNFSIQGYISPVGAVNTASGYARTDYIKVVDGLSYITGKIYQAHSGLNISLIAYYDSNKVFIGNYLGDIDDNTINETIPKGCEYIILSSRTASGDHYANINLNGLTYMNLNNSLAESKTYIEFSKTGYLNSSGEYASSSGYKATDFIPVKYGEKIKGHVYGVRNSITYLAFYDTNRNMIKQFIGESDDGTFSAEINENVPINASYVRLSSKYDNTYTYMYANKIIDSLDWINHINKENNIIDLYVDKTLDDNDLNQFTFNNLTTCLLSITNNTDNLYNVYVKAGEYDLYEEIGGIDFLASIQPDDTAYTINQPWLYNVNLIGQGNVILNYLPSDEDITDYPLGASLYSPLNIRGNVNIENIEINCQNCRYGIHDETSGLSKYYNTYHNYKNVKVNYIKGIAYGNGLGGGFDNGQSYTFDSCYFNSQRTYAWSYHNRSSYGGNFVINNCVFIGNAISNRSIKLSNVGTQTKTNVNFNNCYFNKNIALTRENDAVPSTNCYQVYLTGCNDVNITVDDSLGTNTYEPIVFNTI